jgi:hypothetical protein
MLKTSINLNFIYGKINGNGDKYNEAKQHC